MRRMNELQLTQDKLAEMCGVTQGAIHKIISGKTTRPRIIYELAKSLRVTPEWLREGKTTPETRADNEMHAHDLNKFKITRVPVLRWDDASTFYNMPHDHHSEPIKYITVPLDTIQRPYALIVEGDAMVGPPGADSYPPGSYIVLDPDANASPGSHVMAYNETTGETIFRALRIEGSKRWLTPLNTQYQAIEMTADFIIIGVVEGVWIPRRK